LRIDRKICVRSSSLAGSQKFALTGSNLGRVVLRAKVAMARAENARNSNTNDM
jgi:hypothetical protein